MTESARLDPNWRSRALCAGTASRYFDPWDAPDSMWDAPQDTVEICARCPVRIECLVDALQRNEHCVRAGTTKRQRDALKRQRWRTRCPLCGCKSFVRLTGDALQVCTACGLTWRVPDDDQPEIESEALSPAIST